MVPGPGNILSQIYTSSSGTYSVTVQGENKYRVFGSSRDSGLLIFSHRVRWFRHAIHIPSRWSLNPGPRPHQALAEAIPIAKARGIVQLDLSGPEQVFDIAIISKVPVAFTRVMFTPAILATTRQLADEFKEEIAQLRIIARDAAITAEIWLRSKHGTWRFFLVTPNSLVEIDREGERLESRQTVAYLAGIALEVEESTLS